MNEFKNELATFTNKNKIKGVLTDAVKGRDLFVGVSIAVINVRFIYREL